MNAPLTFAKPKKVVYPESDGKPLADNTKQFRYIVMIEGGIDALFRDDPNVFVAGDLLWYPVEGHPEICTAPARSSPSAGRRGIGAHISNGPRMASRRRSS